MANNYFQFKQFTIQQKNCTMKVGTDACILGAFAAANQVSTISVPHLLDIGTGTGLLSLMFAQETNALLDAVEIDPAAFLQAKENFNRSPWSDRMQIFNTDILTFKPGKKYDLIICNPPFFEDDLRSADEAKNAAKHDTTLTFIQLLKFVKEYLKDEGIFWVLLPFHRIAYFEKECRADGFYMNQKLLIKHTAVHPYFRGILILSKKELPVKESELVIKDANGVYTEAFVDLMRGYYLNL